MKKKKKSAGACYLMVFSCLLEGKLAFVQEGNADSAVLGTRAVLLCAKPWICGELRLHLNTPLFSLTLGVLDFCAGCGVVPKLWPLARGRGRVLTPRLLTPGHGQKSFKCC